MEIKTLEFLPIEDVHIIKQINLNISVNGNLETIGYVYYKRKFADDYKLREVAEEEKDFNYKFNYPPQNIFPTDRLDQIILEAIKSKFPDSDTYNYLIVANIDLDMESRITNRPTEKAILDIFPDIKNLDVYSVISSNKTYRGIRLDINVYGNYSKERINNLFFKGYYIADDENHFLSEFSRVQFI